MELVSFADAGVWLVLVEVRWLQIWSHCLSAVVGRSFKSYLWSRVRPSRLLDCINQTASSLIDSSLGRSRSIPGNIRWLSRIRLPHRKRNTMILAGELVKMKISITMNLCAICLCFVQSWWGFLKTCFESRVRWSDVECCGLHEQRLKSGRSFLGEAEVYSK